MIPQPTRPDSMVSNELQKLIEQIRDDLANVDGDWTRPGFQALAIHRFGNFRMTIGPKAIRAPLSLTYRLLYYFARNFYGIELPYTAQVGKGVIIEHQGAIVVHGSVVIGDHTILRQGVTIGIRNRSRPSEVPVIGASVDIGAGAKILGDVRVGDGSTIAANAVVIRDVAAHSVVGGIPAAKLNSASSLPPLSSS